MSRPVPHDDPPARSVPRGPCRRSHGPRCDRDPCRVAELPCVRDRAMARHRTSSASAPRRFACARLRAIVLHAVHAELALRNLLCARPSRALVLRTSSRFSTTVISAIVYLLLFRPAQLPDLHGLCLHRSHHVPRVHRQHSKSHRRMYPRTAPCPIGLAPDFQFQRAQQLSRSLAFDFLDVGQQFFPSTFALWRLSAPSSRSEWIATAR